jgi:hypothetical protein
MHKGGGTQSRGPAVLRQSPEQADRSRPVWSPGRDRRKAAVEREYQAWPIFFFGFSSLADERDKTGRNSVLWDERHSVSSEFGGVARVVHDV